MLSFYDTQIYMSGAGYEFGYDDKLLCVQALDDNESDIFDWFSNNGSPIQVVPLKKLFRNASYAAMGDISQYNMK
jgi:hypothetical protein